MRLATLHLSIVLVRVLVPAATIAGTALSQDVPAWTLGAPSVRYGDERPYAAQLDVQRVAIGRDLAVYAADGAVVRLYESDGSLTRVFGGNGQRPGEFVLVTAMGWLGDTLWVIDDALDRATFFEPTGRLLGATRVSVPGSAGAAPSIVPFALLPNHSAIVLLRPHPGTTPLGERPRGRLLRVTRRGIPVDTFASVTVDEVALQGRDRVARPLPQPFTDATLFAAAPDGSGLVVVERPAPTAPGTAHYRVTRYTPEGDRVFSTEHAYTAAPIVPELVDSVRSELAARQARGFGGREGADAAVRRSLYAPEFLAPVTDIVAGRDGSIWLARAQPASPGPATITYDVIDPQGRRVAALQLPPGARILAADLDMVWLAEYGERDTQLVRYPLVKGRGAGAPARPRARDADGRKTGG